MTGIQLSLLSTVNINYLSTYHVNIRYRISLPIGDVQLIALPYQLGIKTIKYNMGGLLHVLLFNYQELVDL